MDSFVKRTAMSRTPIEDLGVGPKDDSSSTIEPPSKKPKLDDEAPSDHESPQKYTSDDEPLSPGAPFPRRNDNDIGSNDNQPDTVFESSLPPTKTNDDAIDEYETYMSSQQVSTGDRSTRNTLSPWVKGKSSIYVDAFNFALDTVLEDEAHLFNSRERAVFEQWRCLDYEAQYLSVFAWLSVEIPD
jgi:Fanconi-associated nuclease 1